MNRRSPSWEMKVNLLKNLWEGLQGLHHHVWSLNNLALSVLLLWIINVFVTKDHFFLSCTLEAHLLKLFFPEAIILPLKALQF